MNILEDLWYGQICPIENADYRNPEYRKLSDLLERNMEKLLPALGLQQLEDFQKIEEILSEMD